jgi:hypothetical protein
MRKLCSPELERLTLLESDPFSICTIETVASPTPVAPLRLSIVGSVTAPNTIERFCAGDVVTGISSRPESAFCAMVKATTVPDP